MNTHWLHNIIDTVAERGRELLGLDRGDISKQDLSALCRQLLAGEGEASGIALSQEILRRYAGLDKDAKLKFFELLAEEFAPKLDTILRAVEAYTQDQSAQHLIDLNSAVEPPRQELFRRLNMAPQGTANLVAMRADLLGLLRDNPALKAVDADLKHLLSSWFNRGFLQLREISWESPAHILEKLINYEAVHEIRGWPDLRRRLMQDRRCFAFFHPAMPDEPLIFIEVAFVQGLAREIHPLIDPDAPVLDPKQADTAIFYSINNTQKGLRGISFGNFLIKQVLTDLTRQLPWIRITSTLSPIPGFATSLNPWLDGDDSAAASHEFAAVLQRHHDTLMQLATQYGLEPSLPERALFKTLLADYPAAPSDALSNILGELALLHLTTTNAHGKPPDPVAMFHLSNGARLERINPQADMSAHGIASSHGVMVNYLYDLNSVELNHEAFVTKGQIMLSDALAKQRRQLLKEK